MLPGGMLTPRGEDPRGRSAGPERTHRERGLLSFLCPVLDRLRLSIRAMRAWLRDPEANLAVMEDFEKTEELRICRWCNFRAVCRPEL